MKTPPPNTKQCGSTVWATLASNVEKPSINSSAIFWQASSPSAANLKTSPACFTKSPLASFPFLVRAVPEISPSTAPGFKAPCL